MILPKILRSALSLLVIFYPKFAIGSGVVLTDGHVYIEGVISLYSNVNGSCGGDIDPEVIQNIESVRWTLNELNKDSSNLYGKQIGKLYPVNKYLNVCGVRFSRFHETNV